MIVGDRLIDTAPTWPAEIASRRTSHAYALVLRVVHRPKGCPGRNTLTGDQDLELAVAQDRLLAVEQRLGIGEQELDQPARVRPLLVLRQQRVPPDEPARLVEVDREFEARLER